MRIVSLTLAALALAAFAPAALALGAIDQETSVQVTVRSDADPAPGDQEGTVAEQEAAAQAQQKALQAQQQALKDQQKAMKEAEKAIKEKERVIRIMASDRPRIGVILETEADEETDPIGARIQAVTPGGPADQAGIKADDVIVKFNGKVLAGPNPEADEDESAPATRLLALCKELKDGDKVPVEYRRGKENRSTVIIPRAMKSKDMNIVVEMPDLSELKNLSIPEIADLPQNLNFSFDLPGSLLDMEMVQLNPDLGEYFGTSEGLLIVSAAADSPLKLKAGDVILKIGDRKPATPSQALRILRSYEPKEMVNVEIMRKRQRQTVTATMPEKREFNWQDKGGNTWSTTPKPPKAPKAPAAPKAPEAPAPTPAPAPAPAPRT